LTVEVPLNVGTPEMVPKELIVRPEGNPVAENAYGIVPPEAVTGCE
jgi:hypothetical protein